jgi:magnesium transporter
MAIHHESFLIDAGGAKTGVNADLVHEHLDRGDFFWLDLHRPSESELDLLRDPFGLHPLAVEDAVHFGQRPKLDTYDDFVYLVAYGAAPDRDGLVEVHCFLSQHWLLTVHRDDCPAFEDLRKAVTEGRSVAQEPAIALYRVVDALADSFFPEMAKLDDRIDQLENGVLRRPDDAQLQQVFKLKRKLVGWRKVITPERDLFARLLTGVVELPGMTPDMERYYRDVYDHLIRISDLVDSYRDLLTGAMDVYLSTVSNRLNEIMKRLTIVATIFMPLTFIVGFFGMNFTWMVRNITGFWPFFWLAVVSEVVAVVAMIIWFRRRRWI